MTVDWIATNVNQLPKIAEEFIVAFKNSRIFLFDAEMGSGKTTFIKCLSQQLGVNDNMSSPTYSIVNEYKSKLGLIYHFDLYRINKLDECLDLGMEEYIYSGNYCFIEWPEIATEIYPEDVVKVNILVKNNSRYIKAKIGK